jgi:predicted MFS family arabinose efflux permease
MALLLSAVVFSIRSGVRQTALPLYAEKVVGLGTLEIGLLITGATVASLLLLWPAGRAVDRTRKGVAVLGNLLLAVAVLAFTGADRFETLLAATFGFGVITAFVGVVPAVVASDVIPPKMSGPALGVYRMAGDVGFILGPLLGGLSVSRLDFGPTFSLFAVVALIAGLLALKMRETLPSGEPKEPAVTGLERME